MKFIQAAIVVLFLSSPVMANEEIFTPQQKGALARIIDDHLMKNPEVIASAFENLQQKQMKEQQAKNKELIQKNAARLFDSPDDYVAGNAKALVKMVVFMDPYCGHCRQFHEIIDQALGMSKSSSIRNLKIIFKDLPIFGEASDLAVRAMLAAKLQGKYKAFQKEMFKEEKPVTEKEIKKVAVRLGLNQARLLADMNSEKVKSVVASTRQLAEALGIGGTPTLVVGNLIIPGGISLENLKELVSKQDLSSFSKSS